MNKKISGSLAGAAVVGALLVTLGSTTTPATGLPAMRSAAASVSVAPVQVRLITGDLVSLTTYPSGRQTAAVASPQRGGPGSQYRMFSLGHDMYVVPETAAPYLGKTLSLSLFDVTALARHPRTSLRVGLTLSPGTGSAALPGATVHRTSVTTATASFTPTSARVFGRALARQFARDHASPTHTTGLFASVAMIAHGPAATPNAKPRKDVTLTIDATDWAGNPDNGDGGSLLNVDDMSLYGNYVSFTNGQAQATVPTGHYALLVYFFDAADSIIYQVAVPQFTVKKDTTITIDARKAKTAVKVSVPKDATPQILGTEMGRTDAVGASGSNSFLAGGTYTFEVQPTKTAPTVGSFHYFAYSRLFSPSTAKKAYTYDVKFPYDGVVPANESFTATPSSLARIPSNYPADHTGQPGLDTRFAALPWESFLFASDLTLTAPLHRTEYYTARPDLSWEAVDYSVYDEADFILQGEIDTSWQAYVPGPMASQTYRGQPTHPRLLQDPIYVNQVYCPVCVSSTTLDLLSFPFADNSPNHRSYTDAAGNGLTESSAWTVKADSKAIQSGSGVLEAAVGLVKGTKKYTVNYQLARSSDDFLLSTKTNTTWSFNANAPEAALPSTWVCDSDGDTDCTVPPVMTSDYSLPVNLLGQIKSGKASAEVTIGHLAGSTAVAVTKFTAKVSFDGKTWKNVSVTDDGTGHYTLSLTIPAKSKTNGYGSLKINATDAYGDTIAETITNAFAVK